MQIEFAQQVLAALLKEKHPNLEGLAHEINEVKFGVLAKVGNVLETRVILLFDSVQDDSGKGKILPLLKLKRSVESSVSRRLWALNLLLVRNVFLNA